MYRLMLVSLVVGALGQHQVSQQVTQPERQIRLEDVERDGIKSAAGQSTQYQAAPETYQAQQYQAQQQYQPTQYQIPPASQYQIQPAFQAAQFHLAPQAAYSQQVPALHQQFLSPQGLPAAYHQQLLQPYLLPAQGTPYNFPVMLIPYQVQQEIPQVLLPSKVRPAVQQVLPQGKFRPSPQLQSGPSPYSSQIYQQKFASGVKSTTAPPTKDNYVQNPSSYNFKL